MPLLTITNLLTSVITIQDTAGLGLSILVPGSGAVTDKVVTTEQLENIEPQLNAEQTAGNLRWSVKDNPATQSDSVLPSVSDTPNYSTVMEDFLAGAGTTLPKPWAKDLNGTTTGDYLANTANGVYSLATAAVSEAQDAQLTWGDQLMINPLKKPIFETKVRVNIPGATITADERWVVGLCSAHANSEDALDAVVSNVWFKGEGANLNIYIEGDDGTHDVDDTDSTVDYVDNTYLTFKIDMSDLTKVAMYINGVKVATTLNLSSLLATDLLQPIFCYQRDAGSEINLLQPDWVRVTFGR
jgi:hypothetical protein